MVIKQCDLCKKKCEELHTLRDEYETHDIKELCGDCISIMDKIIYKEMREYLRNRERKVKQYFKDNIK